MELSYCVAAENGPQSEPGMILQATAKLRGEGVSVTHGFERGAIDKTLKSYLVAGAYDKFWDLLIGHTSCTGINRACDPTLQDASVLAKWQESKAINAIVDIMRMEGKEQLVVGMLTACNFDQLESEKLRQELMAFLAVATPWEESVEIAALKKYVDEFRTDAHKFLHKSVLVMPTAIAILDTASTVANERDINLALIMQLQAAPFPTLLEESEWMTGALETTMMALPNHNEWELGLPAFQTVQSSATASFKSRYGGELDLAERAISEFISKVEAVSGTGCLQLFANMTLAWLRCIL